MRYKCFLMKYSLLPFIILMMSRKKAAQLMKILKGNVCKMINVMINQVEWKNCRQMFLITTFEKRRKEGCSCY